MENFDFESLNTTTDGKQPGTFAFKKEVYRARVPGGWLIFVGYEGRVEGTTFYPDPKHEWNGDTLPTT